MASEKSLKHFGLLFGGSQAMESLYRQMERVALTDATVLLEGESGTGKVKFTACCNMESLESGEMEAQIRTPPVSAAPLASTGV